MICNNSSSSSNECTLRYFEKHTAAVPLLINKSITVPTAVKSLAFTVPENHEGSVMVMDPTTGKQHSAHVPGHASHGDVGYLKVSSFRKN